MAPSLRNLIGHFDSAEGSNIPVSQSGSESPLKPATPLLPQRRSSMPNPVTPDKVPFQARATLSSSFECHQSLEEFVSQTKEVHDEHIAKVKGEVQTGVDAIVKKALAELSSEHTAHRIGLLHTLEVKKQDVATFRDSQKHVYDEFEVQCREKEAMYLEQIEGLQRTKQKIIDDTQAALKAERDEHGKTIADLTAAVERSTDFKGKLESVEEKLKSLVSGFMDDSSTIEQVVEQDDFIIGHKLETVETHSLEMSKLQMHIQESELTEGQLSKTVGKLKEELEARTLDIEAYKRRNEELTAMFEEMDTQIQEHKEAQAEELRKCRETLRETQKQLDETIAENVSYKETVTTLKGSLEATRQKLETSNQECSMQKRTAERLQEELNANNEYVSAVIAARSTEWLKFEEQIKTTVQQEIKYHRERQVTVREDWLESRKSFMTDHLETMLARITEACTDAPSRVEISVYSPDCQKGDHLKMQNELDVQRSLVATLTKEKESMEMGVAALRRVCEESCMLLEQHYEKITMEGSKVSELEKKNLQLMAKVSKLQAFKQHVQAFPHHDEDDEDEESRNHFQEIHKKVVRHSQAIQSFANVEEQVDVSFDTVNLQKE